jgi:hypothetical protein
VAHEQDRVLVPVQAAPSASQVLPPARRSDRGRRGRSKSSTPAGRSGFACRITTSVGMATCLPGLRGGVGVGCPRL